MSSHGDLVNALAREKLRRASERSASNKAVEFQSGGWNRLHEDEGIEQIGQHSDQDRVRSEEVMRKVYGAVPDVRDQQVLELMMDGIRATEAYTRVLGINDPDVKQQRKAVKRHKDRIKKRITRLGLSVYE